MDKDYVTCLFYTMFGLYVFSFLIKKNHGKNTVEISIVFDDLWGYGLSPRFKVLNTGTVVNLTVPFATALMH